MNIFRKITGALRRAKKERLHLTKYRNHFVSTADGRISGPYSESPNQQYLVITQPGQGGRREGGKGRFWLIRDNVEILELECQRPLHSAVSDSGVFVIGDSLFVDADEQPNVNSIMYVFDAKGTMHIAHQFPKKILQLAISKNGEYILAQLAGDGDDIYIFTTGQTSPIAQWKSRRGWGKRYELSDNGERVTIHYDSYSHTYTLLGNPVE
ncbi:MAG: hypothetical protein ACRC9Y_09150 [Aeromonas veronii]